MFVNKSQAISRLLIVLGILVLINILFDSFYFRLDFTEDKRFTLSNATKELLKNLEDPVTITAYFSKELPPEVMRMKNDFRDILKEYETYSDHKVVYSFVNPNESQELEQQAARKGIQPLILNINQKDKFEQQKVYLGAVVQQGEKSEIIPALQPGSPMEYSLTFAIKKTSNVEKPTIALLQGHGEAGVEELSNVNEFLSALYQVEPFTIEANKPISEKYKAVIIVAPEDSFSFNDLNVLDQYLAKGGNLFIAFNRVKGNLRQGMGNVNNIVLENWLMRKDIVVKPNFVYDVNCGQISVQQRQGNLVFNTPMSFPYLPVFSNFGDHPASKGLESILLPFCSEIDYHNLDTSFIVTPLIKSSDKSGAAPAPLYFDITKQWNENDFNQKNIPVAIAIEGAFNKGLQSRMVIVSNGEFALNDQQGRIQGTMDNLNFFANAIDWLADESGLADLRTKSVTGRPIEEMEDSKKNMIRYANVLSPIFLVLLIGFWRNQVQKKKKMKWLEGHV